MSRKFKANEVRTKLLLKISSEIINYTNSKMLINSILPMNIYNSYDNIEIILTKSTEFSTPIIKENQKNFFDDSSLKKELEITYMDVFRKINKMIISQKKNQTFYARFDLPNSDLNKKKKINAYKKVFLKKKEDLFNYSIHLLRTKAQNLINILIRKKMKYKKLSNSFLPNVKLKSKEKFNINDNNEDNKKQIKVETKKIKSKVSHILKIENPIIENSSMIYSSNIVGTKNYFGIGFYKHKSCMNLKKNFTNKEQFFKVTCSPNKNYKKIEENNNNIDKNIFTLN
jgi:hypothetical protein